MRSDWMDLAERTWIHYERHADAAKSPGKWMKDLSEETFPDAVRMGFGGTPARWFEEIRQIGFRKNPPSVGQNSAEE